MPCDYKIMSLISARSFSSYFHCGTLQIVSSPFTSDQFEIKKKEVPIKFTLSLIRQTH